MDDDYLAGDAAAALRGAGAEVLCPCPSEGAAATFFGERRSVLRRARSKPARWRTRFEIARSTKAREVPFVFITGYDPDVIPPEFGDVKRQQKPVPFRLLPEAVRELQALLRRCANSLFHPFCASQASGRTAFPCPILDANAPVVGNGSGTSQPTLDKQARARPATSQRAVGVLLLTV